MPAVTVRDVPREVVDRLAARAAGLGLSMESYLRHHLIGFAESPTVEEVLERVKARKRASGREVPMDAILAARDADRR